MNKPISASHLERKLRALAGLTGSNALPDLADLAGFVTVESDRPEWALAGGELLWGIARQIGPVAGQQSFIGVHVGAGSGILSVVERVTIARGSVGPVQVLMGFDEVAGDGIVFVRDFRAPQTGAGTRRFEGTSAAPPAGNVVRWTRFLADVTLELTGPWILPPNSSLFALSTDQNVLLDVSIEGYERPLEGKFEIR